MNTIQEMYEQFQITEEQQEQFARLLKLSEGTKPAADRLRVETVVIRNGNREVVKTEETNGELV